MQNQCARLKIDAERKAGVMLAAAEKNPGTRYGDDTMSLPPTLAELLDTDPDKAKWHSSRWQRVARVPPKVVDEHATRCDLNHDELTTAGLPARTPECVI